MFVHLHNHFTGSYSDSALKIDEALQKAKAMGQDTIALTDHGELACPLAFAASCKKHGIKPIFGCELYFVENAQRCIDQNNPERFHLVALAKNRKGLRNLYALISDTWVLNSYKDQRGLADWVLLEKYHEGLIFLSGCYYNMVSQAVMRGGILAGSQVLQRFRDLAGKDFYVEIGRHGIPEEDKVNRGIMALVEQCRVTPVLTNDVHFQDPDDWLPYEVIMRTRHEKAMGFRVNSKEYWLRSEEEMRGLGFPEEYLAQSVHIAEQCELIEPIEPPQRAAGDGHPDIDMLLRRGEAAHLARIVTINEKTAREHAEKVLGPDDPRVPMVVKKITGLPRRSEPDPDRIVYTPGRSIKEVIPLKRYLGKIMTQWDEQACIKAGAVILPLTPSLFAEKLRKTIRK